MRLRWLTIPGLILLANAVTADSRSVCAQETGQLPLTIRLTPVVQVSNREVRLADVGRVTSGRSDEELPERLRNIDLIEIPETDRIALVDRSLIDVRLQLFGLDRHQYRLLGPDQIIVAFGTEDDGKPEQDRRLKLVSRSVPLEMRPPENSEFAESSDAQPTGSITDLQVEQTIQSVLSTQFRVPLEDLKCQLLQPFMDSRLEKAAPESTRIEVVTPAQFPFGRASLMVRLWDHEQLLISRTAYVDVRRRQQMLIVRKTLSPLKEITADSLSEETRYVDGYQDELTIADVEGSTVRRTVHAGEVLTIRDLKQLTTVRRDDLIRARDMVSIVAHRKGLKFVIPAAEALQNGQMGQLIRVRNLESNRIVTARVIGRGEVEVPL
ncbi:MAG: flagellar basal body P-ring formation chaperone FlgA [Planctomycetaceae bacterium]